MAPTHSDANRQSFDLGGFQVDPQRRTISGPHGETMVEPKIMAVLLILAEHPGEVISREQFLDSVWSHEYGGDESLTRAISHLRKAFGDGPGAHTFIETIPKTGYRLIDPDRPPVPAAQKDSRRRLFRYGAAIGLFFLFVMIFLPDRTNRKALDQPVPVPVSVVLAVLPFNSPSKVSEDTTLARGLASEILSTLSQSPAISVIAGNSSFQFHGDYKQNLDVLSQTLNISHVIDGVVQRSEDGLRVGVRLIDAGTGQVVWSDVMTRPESEIYTIPHKVASEIQTALGVNPVNVSRRSISPDPVAYAVYLQAARRDANSALALDPTSVDALLVLAIINLTDRTDTLIETEGRILSLLSRAPNHSNVTMRMGLLLMSVGRWQEATIYMQKALDLNPLSSLTGFYYGTALLGSGYTGKLQTYLKKNKQYDLYRRSYPWLVDRLLAEDYQAARDFFRPLENEDIFFIKGLGLAESLEADSPRVIRLKSLVDRMVTAAQRSGAYLDWTIGPDMLLAADEGLISHHFACQLLAAAELNDAAFELANARISLGEVWYREIILLPSFGNVRQDTRVMELFEATGQLDYWQQTGKWPDFCADTGLPYDCENAASQYRENQKL